MKVADILKQVEETSKEACEKINAAIGKEVVSVNDLNVEVSHNYEVTFSAVYENKVYSVSCDVKYEKKDFLSSLAWRVYVEDVEQ